MGFELCALFRKFGHIKSYWGEVLLMSAMTMFFIGDSLNNEIFSPYLIFYIAQNDYSCTEKVKVYAAIFRSFGYLAWPLSFQAIFLFVMGLLSMIQLQKRTHE